MHTSVLSLLLQKLVLQGYIIGHVQLRKVKATERDCAAMNDIPYLSLKCRNISTTPSSEPENSRFQSKSSPYLLFGQHGIYDNSGHVIKLNYSRCVICNILCRIDIYTKLTFFCMCDFFFESSLNL